MGEVLKFRRPRRRSRPMPQTQPGTVVLFTGVWYGREINQPDAAPKRTRRTSAKRPSKTLNRSSAGPRDTISC
jgi:hypothetical protein